jgi:dienelactone hydrolase
MNAARRLFGRDFALAALAALASAFPLAPHAEQRVTFADVSGYLSKPPGAGAFPAVVLVHSCLGLPVDRRAMGETIASWGYVALFVDDFSNRGLKETCAVDFPEGRADADAALAFLARQSEVDAERVAVVGFSQGGDIALAIAAEAPAPGEAHFKAAAAFYPPCANRAGARLRIPTLILVGAADEVTPAADCVRLARAQPAPSSVALVIYPGASHGFDMPDFSGGKRVLGMRLQYDRQTAERSRAALREFLEKRLAR